MFISGFTKRPCKVFLLFFAGLLTIQGFEDFVSTVRRQFVCCLPPKAYHYLKHVVSPFMVFVVTVIFQVVFSEAVKPLLQRSQWANRASLFSKSPVTIHL